MAKVVQMNLKVPAALRMAIRAEAKTQGMQINAFMLRMIWDSMLKYSQSPALSAKGQEGE
jgi:hypothetical protein